MSKLNEFTEKIKKIKGIEFIIVGIIGVLIIFLLFSDGSFSVSSKNDKALSIDEYVSSLENRLESTLSQVSGAGKVKVAITVEGGKKTVIATDVTTIKDGSQLQITETPVLVGGKVVVLSEKYPEITGVIIVASGADNLFVKMDLLTAATTLLSVDETKVQILKGK